MTKLNTEIRELTIDELDIVSGGDINIDMGLVRVAMVFKDNCWGVGIVSGNRTITATGCSH